MPDAIQAPGQPSGELAGIERPTAGASGNAMFGSDAVADALSALGLPYIALTPGASFRGLHDSLVNHLGNQQPQMLLCLHEEAAVALAHGWAKVTGKPLAVAVHSNVGLFHATMAIFNAWCDRMPMLIIGATGPVDAARRRPWIDWIHTARDQGAIVRNYVKWDDQPASPGAAREALFRATWLSTTAPRAPVYVNLDAEMQEAAMTEPLPPLDPSRFMPAVPSAAPADGGGTGNRAAVRCGAAADHDGARVARRGSVGHARGVGRGVGRAGHHGSETRCRISDRS